MRKVLTNTILIQLLVIAMGFCFLSCSKGNSPAIKSVNDSQVYTYTDPRLNESQPMNYWDRPESLLNRQAQAILDLVNEVLKRFPPQLPEPIERRMALLMLDCVFHDTKAPERPPVQTFFHSRLQKVMWEIEATKVDEGAMIWKLYNMGFIIRTAKVTIGFDLVRGYHRAGPLGFAVTDSTMKRIVDQCDVLFVSHGSEDHADEWVAQMFLKQGKPVVTPEQVWHENPIYTKITHLKRNPDTLQSLPVQKGKYNLKVVVYPGHQGVGKRRVPVNVWLILTPEGLSFCQTGDQSGSKNTNTWIEDVSKHHQVDVLMPNCWSRDIIRMAQGFDPNLIIPGHENIMDPTHIIDHQEPYWLDYI